MKRIIPALFCAIVLLFPSSVAAKSKKAPKAEAKSSFEKINLNEVSEYDLKQIPGISASKAKALLAYRDEKGEIKSIEELKEINHETKSGKTGYAFATSKGVWKKDIKILIDSGRLVCAGSTKSSKKAAPAKESKSDEQDDGQEESDEPEEY